jgi:hypothetical protein
MTGRVHPGKIAGYEVFFYEFYRARCLEGIIDNLIPSVIILRISYTYLT